MTASGLTPSALETWTPSAQLTAQYARLSVSEPWLKRILRAIVYGGTAQERQAKRFVAIVNRSLAGVLSQALSLPHVLTPSDKLHVARRIFCESYGERNPLMYRLPEVDAFGQLLFAELTAWVSTSGQGPFIVQLKPKHWSMYTPAGDGFPSTWAIKAIEDVLVANGHPA